MAISFLTRTITKKESTKTGKTGTRVAYDVLLQSKLRKSKKEGKEDVIIDTFKIAPAKFEELGLQSKGIALLKDDELSKLYFSIVDEENAYVFKKAKGNKKANETSYPDAVKRLVQYGIIPAERTEDFKQSFKLVATDIQVEGAGTIFELVPNIGNVVFDTLPAVEPVVTENTTTIQPEESDSTNEAAPSEEVPEEVTSVQEEDEDDEDFDDE